MKIVFAICAAILFVSGQTLSSDKPQRIVSMNLCTDQLLLLLADPDKIVSVSYLALEEHSSFVADKVRKAGYIVNHNLPEEILPLDADLVVTGQFLHQEATRLLLNLGQNVHTFPVFSSLDDVKSNIRRMAELLGEKERGEALVQQMKDTQKRLTGLVTDEPVPAVSYHARGYTQGKNTLLDELMTLAGWHNIARDFGIEGYGRLGLEELLLAQPQQMIVSDYAPGTRSLGQVYTHHPALKKLFNGKEPISLDTRLLICGGPMNLVALEQLINARNAH